jgi:hypothetical protein
MWLRTLPNVKIKLGFLYLEGIMKKYDARHFGR